jgi:ribonuclease HIII
MVRELLTFVFLSNLSCFFTIFAPFIDLWYSTSVNTFVATIDLGLAEKLKSDLQDQGFTLTKPPYTLFSAQKTGVSCTLYTSGKLTVQGNQKEDFIAFYLEPEILQSLAYTHPEVGIDLTPHIGVDEAGKGDFFGPLCIAGVQAGEESIKKLMKLGVKDSKQLGDKAIMSVASKVRAEFPHSVIRIFPERYNEMYGSFKNLNRLLAWGHATVIEELAEKTGCKTALIDQFSSEDLVGSALKKKQLEIALTQKTKAEADPVVAAASILARAAFVSGIETLSKEVGFELPKGASAQVVAAGRKLMSKVGGDAFGKFAKLHFKTYQEVLSLNI